MKKQIITDFQLNRIVANLDISFYNGIYTAKFEDEAVSILLSFDVESEKILKSEAWVFEDKCNLHIIQENIIIEAIKRNNEKVNEQLKEAILLQNEHSNNVVSNSYYIQ